MPNRIEASGFDLTEAISDHVDHNIEELEKMLPEGASVKCFLSKEAKGNFEVKIQVRAWKHDFFAHEQGENLYTLVSNTKNKVHREVHRMREKHISNRHNKETV